MRCGCSDDSVVVDDGHGVDVVEHRDGTVVHYTPNIEGSVLTGNGMVWDPQRKRFAVKLAGAGSGLAFDGSGGLYVSDKEGGGGQIPGASVKDLADRVPQQNIVGGWLGAGYMLKPQSTRGSYTYGVQRGIDALHVPVRMLADGTPVVTPDEYMGGQNGNLPSELALNQDIHRWRIMANKCGAWPLRNDGDDNPPPEQPNKGWFGYFEPAEHGLLSLADVFDLVGRSSVLVLQLQFPPVTTDEGGSLIWQHRERSPTPRQVTNFLDRVRVLISRYGLTQSVLVTTASPKLPSGGNEPVDVLTSFHQASINAGPVFPTEEDAGKYPPGETWPQGWSWAVMSTVIPAATVKAYADTGVHCLYAVCNRQHQHQDLVVPSGAGGVLAGDPEYFAGQLDSHPTAGSYAYRKTADTWRFNTVDHGTLPPGETLNDVHPTKRAYHETGQNLMQLGQGCAVADNGIYFVLQGWLSPVSTPQDFAVTVRMRIYATESGGGDNGPIPGMGTHWAVSVDTDAPYRGPSPDQGGYLLTLYTKGDGTKNVRLVCWDPEGNSGAGAINQLYNITNPAGACFDDRGYIVLRVRVNKERVELAGMPAADPENGKPVFSYDTSKDTVNPRAPALGKAYRGGYVFAGRGDPAFVSADPAVATRWRMVSCRANAGG